MVERVALLKKLGYSPGKALDAAREDSRQQREAKAKEHEAEEKRKEREAEEKRRQREAGAEEKRILMIMQDSSLTSIQRQAALETLGDARGSFSKGLALTEYFRVSCMHCHELSLFCDFLSRINLQPFLDLALGFALWCRSDRPAVQMLDLSDKFPSISPPTEGL